MPWHTRGFSGQAGTASRIVFDYLLLPLSGFVSLACFGGICKEPKTLCNLPLAVLHGLGFLWTKTPNTHRRASIVALIAWVWRILVYASWGTGILPISPMVNRAFSTGAALPAETLTFVLEQVHALMLLPGPLVTLMLALHLHALYMTLDSSLNTLPALTYCTLILYQPAKRINLVYSPLLSWTFCSSVAVLPYLVVHYSKRVVANSTPAQSSSTVNKSISRSSVGSGLLKEPSAGLPPKQDSGLPAAGQEGNSGTSTAGAQCTGEGSSTGSSASDEDGGALSSKQAQAEQDLAEIQEMRKRKQQSHEEEQAQMQQMQQEQGVTPAPPTHAIQPVQEQPQGQQQQQQSDERDGQQHQVGFSVGGEDDAPSLDHGLSTTDVVASLLVPDVSCDSNDHDCMRTTCTPAACSAAETALLTTEPDIGYRASTTTTNDSSDEPPVIDDTPGGTGGGCDKPADGKAGITVFPAGCASDDGQLPVMEFPSEARQAAQGGAAQQVPPELKAWAPVETQPGAQGDATGTSDNTSVSPTRALETLTVSGGRVGSPSGAPPILKPSNSNPGEFDWVNSLHLSPRPAVAAGPSSGSGAVTSVLQRRASLSRAPSTAASLSAGVSRRASFRRSGSTGTSTGTLRLTAGGASRAGSSGASGSPPVVVAAGSPGRRNYSRSHSRQGEGFELPPTCQEGVGADFMSETTVRSSGSFIMGLHHAHAQPHHEGYHLSLDGPWRPSRQLSEPRQRYRSPLPPTKVIFKLRDVEPESLRPTVLGDMRDLMRAHGYGSFCISGACVRRGCTLLVVDLIDTNPARTAGSNGAATLEGPGSNSSTSASSSAGSSSQQQQVPGRGPEQGGGQGALSAAPVQAWLNALLSPDASPPPPGSVAHITLIHNNNNSNQYLEAWWQQTNSAWEVRTMQQDHHAGSHGSAAHGSHVGPGVQLTLLHVDGAVARLMPSPPPQVPAPLRGNRTASAPQDSGAAFGADLLSSPSDDAATEAHVELGHSAGVHAQQEGANSRVQNQIEQGLLSQQNSWGMPDERNMASNSPESSRANVPPSLNSSLSYTSFEEEEDDHLREAVAGGMPSVTHPPGSVTCHRMSVLLRMQPASVALIFSGSGAQGSPAHSSSGGTATQLPPLMLLSSKDLVHEVGVQCVARTPAGACLPVRIVDVERALEDQVLSEEQEEDIHLATLDESEPLDVDIRGHRQVDHHGGYDKHDGLHGNGDGHRASAAGQRALVALVVDIDLASTSSPGVVQLELWNDFTLLASAPLLLLPHSLPPPPQALPTALSSGSAHRWLPAAAGGGGGARDQVFAAGGMAGDHTPASPPPFVISDDLVSELQASLASYSWDLTGLAETQDDRNSSDRNDVPATDCISSGNAGFLSDLGSLLYAAHRCIDASAAAGDNGGSSSALEPAGAVSHRGGWGAGHPGSWGGVADHMRHQFGHNRALLTSMVTLADGLLEYTASENLPHISALVSIARAHVIARLQQLSTQVLPDPTPAVASVAGDAGPPASTGRSDAALSRASSSGGAHDLTENTHLRHRSSTCGYGPNLPVPVSDGAPEGSHSEDSGSPDGHCDGPHGGQVHQHHQQQQQTVTLPTPSIQNSRWRAVLWGFAPPQLEQQYALWVAQQCSWLLASWRLLFVAVMLPSIIRGLRLGWLQFLMHLPINLLLLAPYAASIVMVVKQQYRWLEATVVAHAAVRALECASCAVARMPPPVNLDAPNQLRAALWMAVIVQGPTEPTRLVSLLITQALTLFAHIACLRDLTPSWALHIIGARAAAVALGLYMDATRRAAFLRCQQQAQPSSNHLRATGDKSAAEHHSNTDTSSSVPKVKAL